MIGTPEWLFTRTSGTLLFVLKKAHHQKLDQSNPRHMFLLRAAACALRALVGCHLLFCGRTSMFDMQAGLRSTRLAPCPRGLDDISELEA